MVIQYRHRLDAQTSCTRVGKVQFPPQNPGSTIQCSTIIICDLHPPPNACAHRTWSGNDRDFTQDYVSGVASHFGFVSLPHSLGSSLCIFSIALAVSGCFSITCFVMVLTISSHDPADSFCSQGPPSDLQVIVFIFYLHTPVRMHPRR